MNAGLKIELNRLTQQYFNIALSHVQNSAELSLKLKEVVARLNLKEQAELPGYEDRNVRFGKFENREFVVMMTDIRDSTRIINGENGLVNMFLIFYVYAGIVAKIVDNHNGTSTEFLGDGVLNLFDTKDTGRDQALVNSMAASWDIMEAMDDILNPFFLDNELPAINMGIGIDHGITIVTRFGYRNDTDLKAFGKCTYNVSKLCKKVNQIMVSENSMTVWPSGENGTLNFIYPQNIEGKLAYCAVNTKIQNG
jgi:class 3 adenylate cyclase